MTSKHFKTLFSVTWGDGSAAKSTCFCRGPRFHFQISHGTHNYQYFKFQSVQQLLPLQVPDIRLSTCIHTGKHSYIDIIQPIIYVFFDGGIFNPNLIASFLWTNRYMRFSKCPLGAPLIMHFNCFV